jgi:signal transduction histidine kinase
MRAPYRIVVCLCAALIVWAGSAAPVSSATRHVVLLFDERPELPGLAVLDADLVRTLTAISTDHIEIYREAMDLSRFSSSTHQNSLRDALRTKYADKKIDVAVAILGPALDFLLTHGQEIFPGTPIVFCGIDRRELRESALPAHVRGIVVKREFAPTLEIALGIHPHAKRVAVVGGTSEFDTRLLEQMKGEFVAYEDRLAFTYLTGMPLPQLLRDLAQLPPQTIVLFTTLFQDGAGEAFVPHDVVPRVSAAASVPTYGFVDQYLGRGIVGGSLYSFSAQGMEAAKLVLQVMEGRAPPGPLLLDVPSRKALFDWRQLQRWGIGASRLPAGSEIRFRNPTTWERYRVHIVVVCATLLLQAALITWLLHEHRRRRRSEGAAYELSGRLIHAQEEERSRLARELHDDVTQRLALLAIDIGREERDLRGSSTSGTMRSIRERVIRLSEDVHALSYRLHPSVLEDLGLIEALKSESERFSRVYPLKLEVEAKEIPENLPRDAALCLFRIAQEGLRNVARHAAASRVELSLRYLGGGLQLAIKDDGVGFDPSTPHNRTTLGHASMRQRVALLGGTVEIDSRPGRGTTVRAWVPLKEECAHASAPMATA